MPGELSGEAGRCHCDEREGGRVVVKEESRLHPAPDTGISFFHVFFFFLFLNYFPYLKPKRKLAKKAALYQ